MLPRMDRRELKERLGGSLYVKMGEFCDFSFTLPVEPPDFCPEFDELSFLLDSFNLEELVLFLPRLCGKASGTILLGE